MRERLYEVILRPHVSEKSTLLAEKSKQFVFDVLPSANKIEIKQAIEGIFKVKVENVNIIKQKGKPIRRGQILGRRNHTKKAYVRIEKDQDIEFTGLA
jgi:large subunit ribosomal protein L23